MIRLASRFVVAAFGAVILAGPALAQPISASEQARIDQLVTTTLADTGVPSASIALVRDGRIVLARGYGRASPTIPATRADLPYQIASNSKQFTAMALLTLEQEGKLDLDDKVAKWVPGITDGNRITLRQLLSHTAGLQDYWPQDYAFAAMNRAISPQEIIDRWAKKPLDYAPGTRWQYSNTGYVVAGLVVEKAAGQSLMAYLQQRIFAPLGMRPVNIDDSNTPAFPAGHTRYALGPVRLATPPGRGWLYAAGELSMTATDLAKWDIARINRSLLPADHWAMQEAPVTLPDGTATGYGLGVSSGTARGRRFINHGGASVGFLSQNTVYPDDRAAVVVLTNGEYSSAISTLTAGLTEIILPPAPPVPIATEPDRSADARALYDGLRQGRLDRTALTANANGYFTPVALADYRASLAALGTPTSFVATGAPRLRGGFVNRTYRIEAGGRTLRLISYAEPGPSGRWEQYIVMPQ
ncbi:MAG: beta-lactamase family protein [Pseudomonadota bacterium]|nr:beta-lactamase family protein [Pseudomonadota bacterium]